MAASPACMGAISLGRPLPGTVHPARISQNCTFIDFSGINYHEHPVGRLQLRSEQAIDPRIMR